MAAGEWAGSEWGALRRLWELGVPVPYPVQIEETEIMMEWITHDGETAPRVAQVRPGRDVVEGFYDQLRESLLTLVQAGRGSGPRHRGSTLSHVDQRWCSSSASSS